MVHTRVRRSPVERVPLALGDRMQFDGERMRYTVRAVSPDGRWAICVRPFPLRDTVLYTIVDFDSGVRGPDDMVFSYGYETAEDIAENMARLVAGDMEVSYRRDKRLNITQVVKAPAAEHPAGER